MIKFFCGQCKRETNPHLGFGYVECPHCGCITDARKARVEVPDVPEPKK